VLLIYYVDPLLSDVVPFLVLIAMLIVRPVGSVRHARGARPCLGRPARQRLSPHRLRAGPGAGADARRAHRPRHICGDPRGISVRSIAFALDLACQVFLASVGALSLMLLTGYAGQISLGHAGLIAAGAFTTGILAREIHAPFWITLPASAVTGIVLGFVFGLPSLRLRGLYLAVSTLALHFVVIYLGGEYETKRGFSTGILVEPPSLAGFKLSGGRFWYFVLLAAAALSLLVCINLLRSRSGRAFRAVHARETVAEGARHQHRGLQAARFVISVVHDRRSPAAVRLLPRLRVGRGLRPVLSIQYVAMIIIGGMARCSARCWGRVLRDSVSLCDRGAAASAAECRQARRDIFAVNYASFGVVLICS
jgi:branched-chain amino acid transport system permease protein